MKSAAFEYHRPSTPEDVVALLAEYGDSAKLLAGGQSLIPMLALRLTAFGHLIDLGAVPTLHGIESANEALVVGATTSQATIERSAVAAGTVPLLVRATALIGHFQIRNRGTIGGSLAHADPAAEYPAVARALDAQFELLGPAGPRTVAAAEFFDGLWSTAIGDDELLTRVTFPVWTGRCGFAIREFARRHGDFAIAGAVVAVELDGDDRIKQCAVALLGMGSSPERAAIAEQSVSGEHAHRVDPTELARLAVADLRGVASDLHGSAAYRRRVGAATVADAWSAAIEEARNG